METLMRGGGAVQFQAVIGEKGKDEDSVTGSRKGVHARQALRHRTREGTLQGLLEETTAEGPIQKV